MIGRSTTSPAKVVAEDPTSNAGEEIPLFTRHAANPILSRKDWPYPIISVFNAGAVKLPGGTLCCFAEWKTGGDFRISVLPGLQIELMDGESTLNHANAELSRVSRRDLGHGRSTNHIRPELQQYAIAYTSFARGGPGVSLALTKDFKTFDRFGVIMPPEDKDAALPPRKIGGFWALIHRPMTRLGAHMWISYSPDLRQFR